MYPMHAHIGNKMVGFEKQLFFSAINATWNIVLWGENHGDLLWLVSFDISCVLVKISFFNLDTFYQIQFRLGVKLAFLYGSMCACELKWSPSWIIATSKSLSKSIANLSSVEYSKHFLTVYSKGLHRLPKTKTKPKCGLTLKAGHQSALNQPLLNF